MKCPYCNYLDSKVIDSRPTDEGSTIRRRRECINCKSRFTTYERVEETPIIVVKRDGNRQIFDKNKIINGIIKSCEKRPVSIESIEKAADDVEKQVQNLMKKEISSEEIGEFVMEALKDLDEVAYVRFASVYRQFKDVQSFFNELESIMKTKK
ncbi:transcriptional regulator NrdR [Peptoniphilus catoniae]|uniref:transcriptional regulator NrdR n=1 Tax=Peptoniphilus catoniae TaxID=1660341 RepID=UPI0010FEE404|nr:transcriptional regulator NrdR [Peptoniphilus catoniae]